MTRRSGTTDCAAACAVLATFAVLSMSCSRPAWQRYEEAVAQTPAPAAHALHDARLAQMMRELDRLRSERLPAAIDPREERERQAREVARAAASMAASAERIPDAAPEGLDADQRAEFDALARELAHQSRELAAEASRSSSRDSARLLARIDATCRQCHERFRIPGPGLAND